MTSPIDNRWGFLSVLQGVDMSISFLFEQVKEKELSSVSRFLISPLEKRKKKTIVWGKKKWFLLRKREVVKLFFYTFYSPYLEKIFDRNDSGASV